MPYPLALALWQASSFALYLLTIGMILRLARQDHEIVARTRLPRRPLISGVLFGLCAYKPLGWRSNTDFDLKAALLIVVTLLGSPHVLDYDLVILAPAIAFLVSASRTSGFRDHDISLLAFAWMVPPFARAVAGACGVPLGLAYVATLLAIAMQHVIRERAVPSLARAAIAQA